MYNCINAYPSGCTLKEKTWCIINCLNFVIRFSETSNITLRRISNRIPQVYLIIRATISPKLILGQTLPQQIWAGLRMRNSRRRLVKTFRDFFFILKGKQGNSTSIFFLFFETMYKYYNFLPIVEFFISQNIITFGFWWQKWI